MIWMCALNSNKVTKSLKVCRRELPIIVFGLHARKHKTQPTCNRTDSTNYNTMPVTRTTTFKRSCSPSAVNLWNKFDLNTRQKPTLSSFSYILRSQITQNTVPHHYTKGSSEYPMPEFAVAAATCIWNLYNNHR